MTKRLLCNCRKTPGCKLCQGTGSYEYELGPAGWQPFRCPTCAGSCSIADAAAPAGSKPCFTCKSLGTIDPANPPSDGFWDKLTKIFLGG